MRKWMGVMALVVLCAPPAAAQEQTVESAQAFLAMVLPGNGYSAGSIEDGLQAMAREMHNGRYHVSGHAKIIDAGVVARCVSRIQYDVTPVKYEAWQVTVPGSRETIDPSKLFPDPRRVGMADGFNWGTLKEVRQSGSDVRLQFPAARNATHIHVGAEAMAARVAYAIEFLRMKCDPAAGTGF